MNELPAHSEPNSDQPTAEAARPPGGGGSLAGMVHRLSAYLTAEHFPLGDRAQLRRMQGGVPAPAFWKIAARFLDQELTADSGSRREQQERRWALILAALAEVQDLHRHGRSLGHALAEADVTEARVDRLLRAHGAALPHLVRAVVHQLTTRGTAVDLADLAWLVLSDGRRDEERGRRKVAREYYQALYRRQHAGAAAANAASP